MKKLITTLFILALGFPSFGQENVEEQEVKEVIETFFEGFHSRDSMIMKSVVNDKIVMQSISKNAQGEVKLTEEDFGKFMRSIMAIPLTTEFREELHSYSINMDGEMANVWTPYSLFVNDQFRHCGVNSFQLAKQEGDWKIIYLVDTRRREGCDERKVE